MTLKTRLRRLRHLVGICTFPGCCKPWTVVHPKGKYAKSWFCAECSAKVKARLEKGKLTDADRRTLDRIWKEVDGLFKSVFGEQP